MAEGVQARILIAKGEIFSGPLRGTLFSCLAQSGVPNPDWARDLIKRSAKQETHLS